MVGKFLTDPVWWFYLFWAGKFFAEQFKVELKGLAGPLILVYVLADVGSIAGGWFSSTLIKRGWTPNAAQDRHGHLRLPGAAGHCRTAIAHPVGFRHGEYRHVDCGRSHRHCRRRHQGFSANIFTLTSDMFPKCAVSSVVALGGMAGAFGGIIMQSASGVIKEITGQYIYMFIIAGTAYLLAFLMIHLLAPRIERVEEPELESRELPWPAAAALWAVLGAVIGIPLSYWFQSHAHEFNSTFINYLGAIVKGWIFILPEYAKRDPGATRDALLQMRSSLLHPLAYTPLLTAAALGAIGAGMNLLAAAQKAPRLISINPGNFL